MYDDHHFIWRATAFSFQVQTKTSKCTSKKSKQLEKFSAKKIFYTKYGFGSVYFTCAWVRWYLLPINLTTNFPFDEELRTNIDVKQPMYAHMVYASICLHSLSYLALIRILERPAQQLSIFQACRYQHIWFDMLHYCHYVDQSIECSPLLPDVIECKISSICKMAAF